MSPELTATPSHPAPPSRPVWTLPFTREAITPCLGECFHAARSIGQADLYSLTGPAAGWILKDFSARPLWIRLLLTRRVVRRETRALKALQALGGIPRFAGCIGADAFLMERLSGERLPHLGQPHDLRPVTFDALDAMVARMHEMGWAHGDLRRKNILLDARGNPLLIDFGTALYGGPGAGLLSRWLYRRCAEVDRITLARIKQSYLPDAMNERDRLLLDRQPAYLRVGRWMKKKLYRPLKRRHRKETWRKIKAWLGFGH